MTSGECVQSSLTCFPISATVVLYPFIMLQSQIGRKTKKTDEIQFFVVGFRRRTIVASSQGIVVIIAVIHYSSSVKTHLSSYDARTCFVRGCLNQSKCIVEGSQGPPFTLQTSMADQSHVRIVRSSDHHSMIAIPHIIQTAAHTSEIMIYCLTICD